MENHRAGSVGDKALANKIQSKFNEYGLTTWSDEHFVKVQEAPASGYNRFTFKDEDEERPQSFLSYSPSRNVTVNKKKKKPVRDYFFQAENGQKPEDNFFCVFWSRVPSCMRSTGRRVTLLSCRKVTLRWMAGSCWSGLERSALLRRLVSLSKNGQIVFSHLTCKHFIFFLFLLQQVANAAKVKAAAVLIFPDRDDFKFENSEDTTELFGHVSVKTKRNYKGFLH